MKRVIAVLCLLAGIVHAQPLKYTANYARTDGSSQFHVYSSVLNTPKIEFSLFQGTNTYTPVVGMGVYFAYGKSDSDPSMKFMYGSLTNAKAIIQVTSNDFPIQVDGWYAALVLTSSVQNLSVRGQITIRRSPEISSPGVLSKTYAVNGNEYGPFTGSFDNWPFLGKSSDIGQLVSNAVINQNISSAPWSLYPATQTVRLANGIGVTNLNHIVFSQTPSGSVYAGRAQWESARSTVRMGLNDNVNYDEGQQLMVYARSVETNTINKGEVVYLNGAFADNPTIKRASNTSEASSARAIGIAAESIASNASGFVVTEGTVYNLNTTNFVAGDKLYLGPNGSLQTNLPTAPIHGVFVGVVERVHQNAGQIFVHVQNYQEFEELSDVSARGRSTNDFVIWNGTVWTNYARTNLALQSSLSGYLPLAGGTMEYNLDLGGNDLDGVNSIDFGGSAYIGGPNTFYGTWNFNLQPNIPGYQTTTGAVNAANLTNLSAIAGSGLTVVSGQLTAASTSMTVNGTFTLNETTNTSLATNFLLRMKHRSLTATEMQTDIFATTGGLRRTTTDQGTAVIYDSLNLVERDPIFTSNSNRITLLEGYTNLAASSLSSSVWATANSTTNSVQRTGDTMTGNLVLNVAELQFSGLGDDGIRLGANGTSSANSKPLKMNSINGLGQSTTHSIFASYQDNRLKFNVFGNDNTLAYLSEITFVTSAVNPRLTTLEQYTNRAASAVASNVWVSADSTTNYASRIQFVTASNSFNTGITSLQSSVVYLTNLNSIAGAGIGVTNNQLVITNFNISQGATINSTGSGSLAKSYPLRFVSTGISALLITGELTSATTASSGPSKIYWNGAEITTESNNLWNQTFSSAGTLTKVPPSSSGTAYAQTNMESIIFFPYQAINSYSYEQWHQNKISRDGLYRTTYTRTVPSGAFSTSSESPVFYWTNLYHTGNFSASSYLTISSAVSNYWRITTAPTGSTSSGTSGQMAVDGTNLFIYSPNALGIGTARWLRVSGSVAWP